MNELLVGVDFSESSNNALAHAVGLASRFKSNMLWIWVENKESIRHLNLEKGENIEDAVNAKFEELKKQYESQVNPDKIQTRIRSGIIHKEIVGLANENKVGMIVMGAHGTRGFRRFLMGDNANYVIAAAKCPVITIREHRTLARDLKTIVVPIDSSLDTRQKLPIAAKMALAYGAEIHLLGLYFSNVASMRKRVNNYVEQTEKFLERSGIKNFKTHFTKSNNGARTIMNYAIKVDAGLIATMIETESLSSDLWLGSQGQQLVNQSPVPILSITNKDILKSRPGM